MKLKLCHWIFAWWRPDWDCYLPLGHRGPHKSHKEKESTR